VARASSEKMNWVPRASDIPVGLVRIMSIAGLLVFIVMLSSIGIACLFFSKGVQGLAIKWVDRGVSSRIHAARSFMQSAAYLVSLKAIGVIAILCAAFLLWALIHNVRMAR